MMNRQGPNEGFTTPMNPCESFLKLGGVLGFIRDFKNKRRIQGFIPPLKGGVNPSCESFVCYSLEARKGRIHDLGEPFPKLHPKKGVYEAR
jgi:hypothetical protein